jgi:disulfide oxidoreductase YuzD
MKTQEFTIETKKVGAGQFKVTVIDSVNDEIKSYIETDMQIIDAISEDDGMYDITKWDAMQIIIEKSGF